MLKFFNRRFFILFIFPFFLGSITVLGFNPFNLLFVNAFSMSMLFYLVFYVKKKTQSSYRKKPFLKNLFLLGSSYGTGFFLFGVYWITYSLTFDDSFKFLIPFALILIPLFLSLFFSLPVMAIGNFINLEVSSIVLISILFSISDFLRSFVLTGFPWNLWAYSYSWSHESLQILPIIGIFSFNLILITLLFFPCIFFFKIKKKFLFVILFVILLLSNYFYGSYKLNTQTFTKNFEKITFKVVSSGANLNEFKDLKLVISKLIKISEPDKNKKTIFVWPEGVILDENFESREELKKLIKKNFSKNHLIVLGANTQKINTDKTNYFNSFIIIDNELNIIAQYNKKKLVPFGEFLPFEKTLRKIGLKKITHGYNSFTRGINDSVISLEFDGKSLNILPLICYEIIFPSLVENEKKHFNFIINISEDAWFGNSIGPEQHFVKAIFRSIESGSFTIRSANKGISAFISPQGEILKTLKSTETGNIEMDLPILKSKNINTNKNLIFALLLITYVITFIILKKFKL
mgnify:CR=1 FL=1